MPFRLSVDCLPLALFGLWLAALLLLGGSARPEAWSQPAIRIIAIGVGGAALLAVRSPVSPASRPALWLLGAISLLLAAHLVPLPSPLWQAMPGRAPIGEAVRLAGLNAGWRPLSMTPDLTVNSLLATLPAWATAILLARLPDRDLSVLLALLAVAILSGALLGLLQVATGADWLYGYAVTNRDVATGWFANRNHDGLVLALFAPLIAARLAMTDRPGLPWLIGAGGGMMLAWISIAATGSRAALVFAALGMSLALVVLARSAGLTALRRRLAATGRRTAFIAAPLLVGIGTAALFALGSESIHRLTSLAVGDDGRIVLLQPLLAIARRYWPLGSGGGSFPTVFRIDEPDANLGLAWLNHAHDEPIEIMIEAGLPALLILAALLAWAGHGLVRLLRTPRSSSIKTAAGWLGASWLLMLLLGSLVDYPLRTPLGMMVFVVALHLLQRGTMREPSIKSR